MVRPGAGINLIIMDIPKMGNAPFVLDIATTVVAGSKFEIAIENRSGDHTRGLNGGQGMRPLYLTLRGAFTRRVFENLPKLQAIFRCGIGYDNIDVYATNDNHVPVVNNPDFCFEEVSNHAIVLLMACAKKRVRMKHLLKSDGWEASHRIMEPMGSIWGRLSASSATATSAI